MNMPPLFVVGTKLDQAQKVRSSDMLKASSSLDIPCRYDAINLSCSEPKHLAPASTNSIKLAKFFDRVSQNLNLIPSILAHYDHIAKQATSLEGHRVQAKPEEPRSGNETKRETKQQLCEHSSRTKPIRQSIESECQR